MRKNAEKEWLALKAQVELVVKSFRSSKPLYGGGSGVHGYLWVNGRIASSETCVELAGLEDAVCKIPGVRHCHFNID